MPFLFVFFWDSYDSNVEVFNIVLEFSEVVLISFNSFFFCLSYSTVGSLQSAFDPQLLHYSLLIDSSLFFLGPC